jgi:hypothetical protein
VFGRLGFNSAHHISHGTPVTNPRLWPAYRIVCQPNLLGCERVARHGRLDGQRTGQWREVQEVARDIDICRQAQVQSREPWSRLRGCGAHVPTVFQLEGRGRPAPRVQILDLVRE